MFADGGYQEYKNVSTASYDCLAYHGISIPHYMGAGKSMCSISEEYEEVEF